ncbi:hypothetical protein PENSPDRAFT_667084 [Peniophora sp. CONT]|nr:hypothetical protein PENSPDRAFT_667084 [Peniophora sp. CONT]
MSDTVYNSASSQSFDDSDYKPRADGGDSIGVRGGPEEQSAVNAQREDRMAAESGATGRIPKGEAQSLISELRPEERDVSGRTRGVKVDAFKQERAVDEAVDEASSGSDAYNAGF